MGRNKKQIVYSIILGILFSLLINECIYQQPEYNMDVVQADFKLVTPEGFDLGQAYSTINMRYIPVQPYTTMGKFSIFINTQVSKPYTHTSIFSRDIRYNVTFLWRSRPIEERQGDYLGALNSTEDYTMFSYMSFPHWSKPMKEIRTVHGKIRINIEASYYNITSKETLANGMVKTDIYIIHPIVKITTLSLIIVVVSLWLIEKVRIDKFALEKGVRAKRKRSIKPRQAFRLPNLRSIDPFLALSLILFALELGIHYAGLDPLLTLGFYVSHHLAELPAFFFLGIWLSRTLKKEGNGSIRNQIINATFFVGLNLILSKVNIVSFLDGLLVSFPWLIGYYLHLVLAR